MASILNSKIGKVYLLDSNPRQIRESAFNTLCESIQRDENFMRMRGVIVWQVPTNLHLDDGDKSPFVGQIGKLVILGGNMRARALKTLGYTDLKPEWMIEAKNPDGSWISPEEAERLVLIDNGSIGISGSNDYEKMIESFNEVVMRQSGIDFSEFQSLIDAGKTEKPKMDDEIADEVEHDELHGEKNEELQAFIDEREKTRKSLKYIDETGYHLLVVFPDGFKQKAEFLSKADMFGGKPVEVNKDPWIDLVFESVDQKAEFISRSGLDEEDPETGVPATLYGLFCDGRNLAKKMGIQLAGSGLHFRDRIIDKQLAEMAMEPSKQKSEKEIQEDIYAKLKAERKELGMSTRGGSAKPTKELYSYNPDEEEGEDDSEAAQ